MFKYTLQDLKTMTVLYVEDDKDIRESMRKTFDKLFKKIYVACDGKEGLENFYEHKDEIEIIVTDINMPHMNGIDMVAKIDLADVLPIIVTTAHNDQEYLMKAIELHIDKYLTKPIKIKELTSWVAKLVIKYRNIKHRKEATTALATKSKEINEEKNKLLNKTEIASKELKFLRSLTQNYISIIKTDKKGIIVEVSIKFCKLYRYTKDEIIGKSITVIQDDNNGSTEIQKYMLEATYKKQAISTIHGFRTKDGKYLNCDMMMTPHFGADGYVDGYTFYQDLIHI